MPCAAEAVGTPRHAGADPDGAVRAHYLEKDVEDAKNDRVAADLARLDDCDEEDGQGEPPKVMAQLAAKLLAYEVLTIPGCGGLLWGLVEAVLRCEDAFDGFQHAAVRAARDGVALAIVAVALVRQILGKDAQRSFFVDVCVANCHCDGEGRDVHHQNVENQ